MIINTKNIFISVVLIQYRRRYSLTILVFVTFIEQNLLLSSIEV